MDNQELAEKIAQRLNLEIYKAVIFSNGGLVYLDNNKFCGYQQRIGGIIRDIIDKEWDKKSNPVSLSPSCDEPGVAY